jgi:WhiB family redox-sensing transcriptional regulator
VAWQDRAACIGEPQDLFFPAGLDKDDTERQAKKVCARCPVRFECREYAISEGINGAGTGIWGGMMPDERRRLIRRRRSAERRKQAD